MSTKKPPESIVQKSKKRQKIIGEFFAEIDNHTPEQRERFAGLLVSVPPWSIWYELPYRYGLRLLIELMGLDDWVLENAEQPDPSAAVLDIDAEFVPKKPEFQSEQEKELFGSSVLSLAYALRGQIAAVSLFDLCMSDLVERGRKGDDESLFKAVHVDPAAITAPTIARRIQRAEILDDRNFFRQLSKALTKTRPRRPDSSLAGTRLMVAMMEEAGEKDQLTLEQLYQVLVEQTALYPAGGQDPFEGLKKLIQRRKKVRGT